MWSAGIPARIPCNAAHAPRPRCLATLPNGPNTPRGGPVQARLGASPSHLVGTRRRLRQQRDDVALHRRVHLGPTGAHHGVQLKAHPEVALQINPRFHREGHAG